MSQSDSLRSKRSAELADLPKARSESTSHLDSRKSAENGRTLARTARVDAPDIAQRNDAKKEDAAVNMEYDSPSLKTSNLSGRLDIIIPEESQEAGSVIKVSLIIRNPLDVPVEIISVQPPQSSLLKDIASPESKKGSKSLIRDVVDAFVRPLSSSISVAGLTMEFEPTSPVRTMELHAERGSKTIIQRALTEIDRVKIHAEEGAEVIIAEVKEGATPRDPARQTIAPHCEAIESFITLTKGWVFFKPVRLNLSSMIRYRLRGEERTQVVTSSLDVKPPLTSIVLGSVAGGLLGATARSLTAVSSPDWQEFAVKSGAAVVMSLIAAVALARKTGSQGFITVEDFFGGFVVGTLIGYGGSQYFEQAIAPARSPGSPPTIDR